jgi:uncharacterized membrane protein
MKTKLLATFSFLLISLSLPTPSIHAQSEIVDQPVLQIKGEVISRKDEKLEFGDMILTKNTYEIRSEGGEILDVERNVSENQIVNDYKVGDKVIILQNTNSDGESILTIIDYQRTNSLIFLIVIFALLTLLIAKGKGFMSLIGLGFSFLILFQFILPQLSNGKNPMLIALAASAIIIPVNFYLSHGFNKKTSIAVLATLITLIIGGLMTESFVNMAKLTGFSSDDALFLQQVSASISIKGLLLASIIIGFLGILDDITISQSAIAFELYATDPKLSFKKLYQKTMNVGKDHITSLVNTLILVYTSTALPLLLLFEGSGGSFLDFVNREMVAEEIVRTMIASIGLILAVPITTLLACVYLDRFRPEIDKRDHKHHGHKH